MQTYRALQTAIKPCKLTLGYDSTCKRYSISWYWDAYVRHPLYGQKTCPGGLTVTGDHGERHSTTVPQRSINTLSYNVGINHKQCKNKQSRVRPISSICLRLSFFFFLVHLKLTSPARGKSQKSWQGEQFSKEDIHKQKIKSEDIHKQKIKS